MGKQQCITVDTV